MEEVIAALTGKNSSINRAAIEHYIPETPDETTTPLLTPEPSTIGRTARSTVSAWSSSIAKKAHSFTSDADEDDDDDDVCDNLIKNIRQRTQEATIRLPSTTKIDTDYHRKARRRVRTDCGPICAFLPLCRVPLCVSPFRSCLHDSALAMPKKRC